MRLIRFLNCVKTHNSIRGGVWCGPGELVVPEERSFMHIHEDTEHSDPVERWANVTQIQKSHFLAMSMSNSREWRMTAGWDITKTFNSIIIWWVVIMDTAGADTPQLEMCDSPETYYAKFNYDSLTTSKSPPHWIPHLPCSNGNKEGSQCTLSWPCIYFLKKKISLFKNYLFSIHGQWLLHQPICHLKIYCNLPLALLFFLFDLSCILSHSLLFK